VRVSQELTNCSLRVRIRRVDINNLTESVSPANEGNRQDMFELYVRETQTILPDGETVQEIDGLGT